MLIKEKPLQHWIDHFYGYGSWDASIWFVNYEEPGGDLPEEVAEKLDYFYLAHGSKENATLCEIRDLYRHATVELEGTRSGVFKNLYEYRFGPNAVIHGIWKNLIGFIHGYKRENLPDLLEYQKKSFLTHASDDALINLYPLPSPHNHAWYYSWVDFPHFTFLKRRAVYEQHVYQHRIADILTKVAHHKPKVVLMYDMSNINFLKQSIQEVFPGTTFTMEKAIPHQIPQHHCADLNGTRMLITTQTPALKHGRVESGFDWYELGKKIRSGR